MVSAEERVSNMPYLTLKADQDYEAREKLMAFAESIARTNREFALEVASWVFESIPSASCRCPEKSCQHSDFMMRIRKL